MEQVEIEHWAQEIRGLARLTDEDFPTGPEIAVRVVGAANVKLSASDVGARLEGRTIIVPEGHEDISHAFAHELAELVLRDRARFRGPHLEKERAANKIAAAILAPARPFQCAVRHFARRLAPLSEVFGLSGTGTHLRILEALSEPGAVIGTRRSEGVSVRNPAGMPWAALSMRPALVAFAGEQAALFPGLVKTIIRGRPFERGRVAIAVA